MIEEITQKFRTELRIAEKNMLIAESIEKIISVWNDRKLYRLTVGKEEDSPITFDIFESKKFLLNGGIPFNGWLESFRKYLNVYKFCKAKKNPDIEEIEEQCGTDYDYLKSVEGAIRFIKAEYEHDDVKIWKMFEIFDEFISDKN